jgi:nucleoside-diphosphate-sugar epimerase
VTGGTGFLGRRLVARLVEEGREVVILGRTPPQDLDRTGIEFIRGAIEDAPAAQAACRSVETVFHVAARVGVWGPYEEFHRTNVLGTRAVLDACRVQGVKRLVYTSTPSVVYNGRDLAGADESWPLTTSCPSPYPLTKAIAEREVCSANSSTLATVALRPHLIWGVGDPHLVPRVLERARTGRLRIVGNGRNRVDMVHVENAVDAHLLAERALMDAPPTSSVRKNPRGRAYFITNDEPVLLWDWINGLLTALGRPAVTRRVSLSTAMVAGRALETVWRLLRLNGEPPMTRFLAAELAKDHWFDITAAQRDLGYVPRVTMKDGTAELVASLQQAQQAPR